MNIQYQASDPDYCVWVSASAGTGKTKILTDRVIRLLIKGVEFNKIMCLTFTNAAANEMQGRINTLLAKWAHMSLSTIRRDLRLICGKNPTHKEVQCAGTLYDKLLNSKQKINIHTIHSFCQKILKNFPIEAGINPNFEIIDEIRSHDIFYNIKEQLYLDPSSSHLIDFLVSNFHDVTINEIFDEIIAKKLRFKALFVQKKSSNQSTSKYSTKLKKVLNDAHMIEYEAATLFDECSIVLKHLDHKSTNDITSFFLNKDSSKKKRIIPKNIADKNPKLLQTLETLQEKVYTLDQVRRTARTLEYSKFLVKLASIYIDKYENYKQKHSLLDYDDLIYFTKELLNNNASKDWILYKLDGGIDHILVDEAQDTSVEQWKIIEALISEFYSGDTARLEERTIFVVGDEKQSIFSFQGADIESFFAMNDFLTKKLLSINKDLHIIDLKYSYRSTSAILKTVYNTFQYIKDLDPELFAIKNPNILSFRTEKDNIDLGQFDIWPLINLDNTQDHFWLLPNVANNSIMPAYKMLAMKIVNFIKHQISNKVILPSTGKPATASDFMILVRTRDDFSVEIIQQLKHAMIDCVGNDLIKFDQNLSILDLISAAKFTLTPHDDLNLAQLLKSPIISITEEDLQELCANKGTDSMWHKLVQHANSINSYRYLPVKQVLDKLLELYAITDVSNFFHILVDCFNFRDTLNKANGSDSNDAINELLYLSGKYGHSKDTSLQNFIYWIEANNLEIKRNIDTVDQLRVMTVHGSKGLQAPVVILCDTTSLPMNRDKFLWTAEGELISSMNANSSPQFLRDIKKQKNKIEIQEYLRLLYVAMTRAQDHLIVCGYTNHSLPTNCWYELISKTVIQELVTDNNDDIPIKISCSEQLNMDMIEHNYSVIDNIKARNVEPVVSQLHSVLSINYSMEYGKVFHKILEDCVKAKSINNIDGHPLIETLIPRLQNKLRMQIALLSKNNEFIDLFQYSLKTEVNIGIQQNATVKSGRIDLLVIQQNNVIIIDYKSDVNPPQSKYEVPIEYIDQLHFYQIVIKQLYPEHIISSKILWLDSMMFMDISQL